MLAVFSLLLTLALSLLVTRVAAMALMLTGLSREMARFQARSAFSGVGFTTSEAESIVGHPVRRRIVMILMLLGNLGIATVVATVLASLMQVRDADDRVYAVGLLVVGLAGLWMFATSRFVERQLNRWISYVLRSFGSLELRDYVAVLQLQNGFAVTELTVEPHDWLADASLLELRLPAEGVLVLGIQRPGAVYLGAPTGDTEIHPGDTLVLYGQIHRLEELDRRRKGHRGDEAHRDAIDEHEQVLRQQEEEDPAAEATAE